MRARTRGFTLIELVTTIGILGILAVTAVPYFFDLDKQAKQAAEEGVVAGIRDAVSTFHANAVVKNVDPSYPQELDGEPVDTVAGKDHPLFVNILDHGGVAKGWTKVAADQYRGPSKGLYQYEKTNGKFLRID